MILPDTTQEKLWIDRGYRYVIGIDEAGRGPLCGSVVASAVVLKQSNPNDPRWKLIRDSKKLSQKQRLESFSCINEYFCVGIGKCDSQTIDDLNILEATFLAMKRAVTSLRDQLRFTDAEVMVLLDGKTSIPDFSLRQETHVGGDAKILSVAAASVVAKVTRDEEMFGYHKTYPIYAFYKHKGYGTKEHLEKLRKFGPCPIHRRSFKPVREAITHNKINRELGGL